MMDSLSHAVANAIQATMINSYRDTFNLIVVPSFEKAVTNMFQQTNEVFRRGTKDCKLQNVFIEFIFDSMRNSFRFTRND